jgi:chemotaxis protein methyltransferase CheR
MKDRLPDVLLLQLSEFIAAGTALQFSPEHWNDLDRRAGHAAKEFCFGDKEAFVRWLLSSSLNKEQLEIVASHLTVSETYFWREPRIFDALEKQILPELIRSREGGDRRLRIWSAGCATGEEPYSIAIALKRVISGLSDWHITILATDINTRILRKAMVGVYGNWSFRNAPIWLKKDYFRRLENGKFEIIPEIRKMVTFEYLNLAEDIYPSPLSNTSAMDLIFCRNVLMYFSPERGSRIVNNFYKSLVDGGWLSVGASELSCPISPQFTSAHFPGATAYRKLRHVSRPSVIFNFEDTIREQAMDQSPLNKPHEADPVLLCQLPEPVKEERPLNSIESLDESMPQAHVNIRDAIETQEKYGAQKPAIALSVRGLADEGRLAEALALCEKALIADKLDPEMHYLRAIILHERNDEDEAIVSLRRALYINSGHISANFLLGNMLIQRGKKQAGKKYLQHVLTLLKNRPYEDILPESDGLTSGRLKDIVDATIGLALDG